MLKIGTVTDELRMMRLRFTEPENLCDHVRRFSSAHGNGSSTSSRRHSTIDQAHKKANRGSSHQQSRTGCSGRTSNGSSSSQGPTGTDERLLEAGKTEGSGQERLHLDLYMCHLDKFGLVRTAETTSKSFSVEFKKHSDAKNYIEKEGLGLLHLRIFDVWVQEVKKVIMENNAHSANCL